MKSLSGALSAALGAPVQRPAVLVQIGFSPVQRWSSMSTLTWGGHSWVAGSLRIDDLQVGPLRVSGTLVLGNQDDVAGTLVLGQGIKDRPILIYGYDAAATDSADVVWLAEAVGGSAQVSPREVAILLRHRCDMQLSPRTYVNPEAGFTHLLPAGTVLRINGQAVQLERRN